MFPSELAAQLHAKGSALGVAEDLQQRLQAAQAEVDSLHQRLGAFVRGNVDGMLASRLQSDRALTTEGACAHWLQLHHPSGNLSVLRREKGGPMGQVQGPPPVL
jgi:hypothetical protein